MCRLTTDASAPQVIALQSENCDPLLRAAEKGETTPAQVTPAPTLAEILEALPKFDKNECCLAVVPDFPEYGKKRLFGQSWEVGYTDKNCVKDATPATAALRLWLEVEGVKDEQ